MAVAIDALHCVDSKVGQSQARRGAFPRTAPRASWAQPGLPGTPWAFRSHGRHALGVADQGPEPPGQEGSARQAHQDAGRESARRPTCLCDVRPAWDRPQGAAGDCSFPAVPGRGRRPAGECAPRANVVGVVAPATVGDADVPLMVGCASSKRSRMTALTIATAKAIPSTASRRARRPAQAGTAGSLPPSGRASTGVCSVGLVPGSITLARDRHVVEHVPALGAQCHDHRQDALDKTAAARTVRTETGLAPHDAVAHPAFAGVCSSVRRRRCAHSGSTADRSEGWPPLAQAAGCPGTHMPMSGSSGPARRVVPRPPYTSPCPRDS